MSSRVDAPVVPRQRVRRVPEIVEAEALGEVDAVACLAPVVSDRLVAQGPASLAGEHPPVDSRAGEAGDVPFEFWN